MSVTVHNDPEEMPRGGIYLIGCSGFAVSGNLTYFGLQTNVHHPWRGGQGRGAIFSRWYSNGETRRTRLADTRVTPDGWVEASDYEGSFVSVRRRYPWETGTYTMGLRAADTDVRGRWFEYWVADEDGVENADRVTALSVDRRWQSAYVSDLFHWTRGIRRTACVPWRFRT